MATRTGTITTPETIKGHAVRLVWTGLLQGDDGSWLKQGQFPDKSIHVYGTWGGATVTFQGSNDTDASPAGGAGLHKASGSAISFTADGIEAVLENVLQYRPVVTGGDGTTTLTVAVLCNKAKREVF